MPRGCGTWCWSAGEHAPAQGHRPRAISVASRPAFMSWGQDIDHETVPLPVQPGLSGAPPQAGRLHRPGGPSNECAPRSPRGGRPFSMVLVGMIAGGQADRRLRAGLLAGFGYRRRRSDRLPDLTVVRAGAGLQHCVWATCRSASRSVGNRACWSGLPGRVRDREPGQPDRGAAYARCPFRPSANPSARELAHARGEDAID